MGTLGIGTLTGILEAAPCNTVCVVAVRAPAAIPGNPIGRPISCPILPLS